MVKKNAVVLPELEVKPKFRTYYDREYYEVGLVSQECDSLTDQAYKAMTDVNYLLEHMAGHSRTPIYGVQDNMTFEDWSNEMALLKRRFNDLSPDVKKQFNSPQEFLQWCSNPENYQDDLPSVVEGRISQEKLEKEKQFREEKATLLASKIAEVLGKSKE